MATAINFASLLTFTGAGKAKREASFARIANTAQMETASRSALIADCQAALGKTPSDAEIAAVRLQVQIGRVAGKISKAHLANPKQVEAFNADPLAFALELVTKYAAPTKPGTKERKLRAGQTGRRTDTQHKLVRASDEAWSKLAADIGIGAAMTQKEKDETKAKRAAHHNDTTAQKFGKDAAKPTHAELVSAPASVDADAYVQHMQTQLSTLMAFDAKHAKVRPLTHSAFSDALMALRKVANDAANAYQLKRDKEEASK